MALGTVLEVPGYVAVFAVASAGTFLLTPVMRWVALRVGAVVAPDERRVHREPTPLLGGVAMFIAFAAALGVAWRHADFELVFARSSEPLGVLLGAGIVMLVGLLDDVRDWSAPAKVSGLVLAGGVMSLLGVTMFYFRVPFVDLVVLSPDLAPLVTVLWVLGMANAVNLIDGLDGLAAGVVAIAAGAFFLYTQRLSSPELGDLLGESLSPVLCVAVLGVCVGFLPHNFHPARIFMGDAGALFLGTVMAASTMLVGGRIDQDYTGASYFFFAPLFIPLFILGVPIVDTLFAIVRRATKRTGLATADKGHLHHRLMRLGHGQRRSVLILWMWTAILSGFVLVPTYRGTDETFVPFGVAALGLTLYTLFAPGLRRGREALGE